MVDNLKPGSVCVDLAAERGGNIVGTKKDEMYVTDKGVTMIGYTDLNSRLGSTSSSLYANNQMKWILSAVRPVATPSASQCLSACTLVRRGRRVVHTVCPGPGLPRLPWAWTRVAPEP